MDKQHYYENMINISESKSKIIWNITNRQLGRSKKQSPIVLKTSQDILNCRGAASSELGKHLSEYAGKKVKEQMDVVVSSSVVSTEGR